MDALVHTIQQQPTHPQDIIALEGYCMQYLTDIGSHRCHKEAGWSRHIPRWHPDNTFAHLQQHYWKLQREVSKLGSELERLRLLKEQQCEHVWERDWDNRDERSRSMCTKCGKFR